MRGKRFGLLAVLGIFLTGFLISESWSATLPPGFKEETLISGMSYPVGLAFLPDGRMLIIEQAGRVRLSVNGVLRTTPMLDITADVLDGGEQGLLGIAVDPDYPSRPYVYLYYTNTTPNLQYVVRYTVTGTLSDPGGTDINLDTNSRIYLLNDIPNSASNHNGGTVRFGPDKTLYISIGDDADACGAQNRTLLKGVILRIKVDDTIVINSTTKVADKSSLAPSDNPWISSSNLNERLVWAYGLRNPFRFTVDQTTGWLVIGDVGSSIREELDLSTGGENFGWPYWEGSGLGTNTGCGGATATFPIYDVAHYPAESIMGGPVYRGTGYPSNRSFPPEYEGVIFFTDYYEGFLRALRNTGGIWTLVSPLGLPNGDFGSGLVAPSELIVGPDGAIYYTAHWAGQVRRIGYIPIDLNSDSRVDSLDLGILLTQWGVGSGKSADFDGDGDVDTQDLETLLGVWSQ